jgi:hypothetical protein
VGGADAGVDQVALLWVLNLSDGSHSLLDIAERAGLPFAQCGPRPARPGRGAAGQQPADWALGATEWDRAPSRRRWRSKDAGVGRGPAQERSTLTRLSVGPRRAGGPGQDDDVERLVSTLAEEATGPTCSCAAGWLPRPRGVCPVGALDHMYRLNRGSVVDPTLRPFCSGPGWCSSPSAGMRVGGTSVRRHQACAEGARRLLTM